MPVQEDEVSQQPRLKAASGGEAAVKLQWGSFAWERDAAPALNHLSLEVTKGQLVMVVGKVGAGKSSLLAALLGELHSRGGSLQVGCSQATQTYVTVYMYQNACNNIMHVLVPLGSYMCLFSISACDLP